jgi:Xaa-Pro dipeptidase
MLDASVDRVFCPHGLGHHLGLDVHDTSEHGPVPTVPLEPGFVVTCEPGVYIMPLLVERACADPKQAPFLVRGAIEKLAPVGGVRIEDNVALLPPPTSSDGNAKSSGGAERAWLDARVNAWLDNGSSGKSSGSGGETGVLNLTEAAGFAPKHPDEIAAVMAAPAPTPLASARGPRALDYNPHV